MNSNRRLRGGAPEARSGGKVPPGHTTARDAFSVATGIAGVPPMAARVVIKPPVFAVVSAIVATAGGLAAGAPLAAALAGIAVLCGAWALLAPAFVPARDLRANHAELETLRRDHDLQAGVFEVSAELVGCVDETDARLRFAAALRRWWACAAVDLLVWHQGAWRSLGGDAHGVPPLLESPVQLPDEAAGDLVLDLSPAVAGQAALVLRGACAQPSLDGHDRDGQRRVAEVLRAQLALSLRRVILYGEMQALARTDPLTGAHRRWYGDRRLRELVDRGDVVAVAMVDIDRFKDVNDRHGHAAGDRVLAAVGRALGQHLRGPDLVCRFGGEEFLLLLPDTGPDGAQQVAERLRTAVSALHFEREAQAVARVTVSIGIAACHQDETADALVWRADQALLRAKRDGRDRVVLADHPDDGAPLRTLARSAKTGGTTSIMRRISTADPR